MGITVNLGIAGPNVDQLKKVEVVLADHHDIVQCTLFPLSKERPYPQASELTGVDVLLIVLDKDWQQTIELMANQNTSSPLPFVICGPDNDANITRQSFKAGAQDYIGDLYNGDAIVQVVQSAARAQSRQKLAGKGDLTLFVTPKGGAGTTTLAVNLAHILAARAGKPDVLIMDLDLQYGNLPLNFDENPNSRLARAISNDEEIDESSLDACLLRKEYNPQILATFSDELLSPWDIDAGKIDQIMDIVTSRFDHVVVDMPRSIDPIAYHPLERANRICVVVQQTLSDMRIASHYIRLLQDQGISSDTICLIINRYEKKNSIREQDFHAAFSSHEIYIVPNDYKRVSYATDTTTALTARWKNAFISRTLVKLSNSLWPLEPDNAEKKFSWSRKAA